MKTATLILLVALAAAAVWFLRRSPAAPSLADALAGVVKEKPPATGNLIASPPAPAVTSPLDIGAPAYMPGTLTGYPDDSGAMYADVRPFALAAAAREEWNDGAGGFDLPLLV